VEAQKSGDELRRSLQANVEYARSIFATRVALECPDGGRLLEEEIAAVMAREEGGSFARDLKAIAVEAAPDRKRA
jgi:hypothetical protein